MKVEIEDRNIRIFGKNGDIKIYIGDDPNVDYVSISICKGGIEHSCGNSIYIYKNHTIIDGKIM